MIDNKSCVYAIGRRRYWSSEYHVMYCDFSPLGSLLNSKCLDNINLILLIRFVSSNIFDLQLEDFDASNTLLDQQVQADKLVS